MTAQWRSRYRLAPAACLSAFVAVFALPVRLPAQEHVHPRGSHGQVGFVVSCSPDVQDAFNDAVALLHSFEYQLARRAFQDIASRDPACGMAHWGVAMTYYHPVWAPPMPEEFAAGRAAALEAAQLGAPTDRERAYIEAIGAFYDAAPDLDHRERASAYRKVMERAADAFADDETTIFFALALLATAPPSDTTFANQKRAAGILTGLLPKHPQHPGIAHYTIHAFDTPQLAELALPAARVYASIAPRSAHALHMPTHIFTRLGLWDESISGNLACERSGAEQAASTHPGTTSTEGMHCGDYLVYAYLQRGADRRAQEVVAKLNAARRFNDPNFAAGYAAVATPARYALERGDWGGAATLTRPEVELPWSQFRYAEGVTYFANAIGAARSADISRAEAAVQKLERLHAELAAAPPAGPYDWAGQVESARRAAAGWLALAQHRRDEAVTLLMQAAELEETVGKHPVTPGAVLPARELLGDLLLEIGRPGDALAAYEGALADAPRRFRSVLGAARAARAAERPAEAARYYRALLELAGDSNTRRAELAEAGAFLAAADSPLSAPPRPAPAR